MFQTCDLNKWKIQATVNPEFYLNRLDPQGSRNKAKVRIEVNLHEEPIEEG